jgi:hypothetical protein
MLARFEADFSTIVRRVHDAGDHEIILVNDFQDRIGIGATGTVIFRRISNARGFGAIWRAERRTLSGLGARNFDANWPDDDPVNRAFLDELERRLSVRGDNFAAVESRVSASWKATGKWRSMALERAKRCY